MRDIHSPIRERNLLVCVGPTRSSYATIQSGIYSLTFRTNYLPPHLGVAARDLAVGADPEQEIHCVEEGWSRGRYRRGHSDGAEPARVRRRRQQLRRQWGTLPVPPRRGRQGVPAPLQVLQRELLRVREGQQRQSRR